jgi:antirestriction protein ArdC
MAFKAAFIFIAPETDYTKHKSVIATPVVELATIGVKSYDEAEHVARELAAAGVTAFELCAGFGVEGTARVAKAVAGKAVVGVVRFDLHPGFEHQSGDALFG